MKIIIKANRNLQKDFFGSKDALKRVFDGFERGRVDAVIANVGGFAALQSLLSGEAEDRLSPVLAEAEKRGIDVWPRLVFAEGMFSKERERLKAELEKANAPAVPAMNGCYTTSAAWEDVAQTPFVTRWGAPLLFTWACPAWDSNRKAFVGILADLLKKYPKTKAIEVDAVRYPNSNEVLLEYPCDCAACRKGREPWYGAETFAAADVQSPPVQFKEFEFRRAKCREIFAGLKEAIRSYGAKLVAAARPDYYSFRRYGAALAEGQDWAASAHAGLLDVVIPMTYTPDEKEYEAWLGLHALLMKRAPAAHYTCISKSSSAGFLTPDQMFRQAEIVSRHGIGGIAVLSLKDMREEDWAMMARVKEAFG